MNLSKPLFAVVSLVMLAHGTEGRAENVLPAQATSAPGVGIAASHPNDGGIAENSAVLLADDFESWGDNATQPPAQSWAVRTSGGCKVNVVPGQVEAAGFTGPGGSVLEVAYWNHDQGASSGGLELLLGNYNSIKDGRGEGYDRELTVWLKLVTMSPAQTASDREF